jgi:hypothetical protein
LADSIKDELNGEVACMTRKQNNHEWHESHECKEEVLDLASQARFSPSRGNWTNGEEDDSEHAPSFVQFVPFVVYFSRLSLFHRFPFS